MESSVESERNIWVLPLLILWALTPALLIATPILWGWHPEDAHSMPDSGFGQFVSTNGFLGMPFILYPWGVVFVAWSGKKWPVAFGHGIPLAIVMCIVNLFLGLAGCAQLAQVVPREGLF